MTARFDHVIILARDAEESAVFCRRLLEAKAARVVYVLDPLGHLVELLTRQYVQPHACRKLCVPVFSSLPRRRL